MGPVLSYAVQLVLGILVPWAIVRFDMKRLPPERLDHAWTEASFWMAIVAFGPLCLPFHFTKTRKNRLIGLALGFAWLAIAVVVLTVVDSIIALFV
jgi:hypothetical protein